ncbi:MAG: bifunctional 4-hydroxy-2-oxoglutarate aldolase/2-dehydro-3-deoxy-phosphogluconate aldolase [Lachnospiraceae bacterium]|nr:bifunctional 4-hydroxy-2-oxoglutarate aldolase/2-dehydro-3-deoxy-phosphogluconate aldolase [Lachnospiraceae bacterium]
MYEEIKSQFEKIGIIPVVVLEDAKDAKPLGEALMKGGLPAAEVTFRTEAAEEAIRILSKEFPDMLVGAGTVLTCDQADAAMAAGAKFIVAPGFNPTVVKHCLEKGYPVTPGVQTPGEMEQAMELGLDFVKFFPAEPAGGLPMIKAVAAPYTNLKFMPTGGINKDNVKDYLRYNKIVACGGTWMVKGNLIEEGNFQKVEELTREAAAIVKEIRGGN